MTKVWQLQKQLIMNIDSNVLHENISKWNQAINKRDNTLQQNGIHSNNSRQVQDLYINQCDSSY